MAQLPKIGAYPRNVMRGDGATVTLRPLEENDKLSLLDFFTRVPPEVVRAWPSTVDFD